MSNFITWVLANYQLVLTAVVAFLTGIVAVLMVIPGDQGESKIQGIINFIKNLLPGSSAAKVEEKK